MAAIILAQFGLAVVQWVGDRHDYVAQSFLDQANNTVAEILARGGEPTRQERRELRKTIEGLEATQGGYRDVSLRTAAVLEWEYAIGSASRTVRELSSKDEDTTSSNLNRLWRPLYGDRPFRPGQALSAESLLKKMHFQRIADLARIHLLEKTGQGAASKAARQARTTQAKAEDARSSAVAVLLGILVLAGAIVIVWYVLMRASFRGPTYPRTWDLAAADSLGGAYIFQTVVMFAIALPLASIAMLLFRGASEGAVSIYAQIPAELIALVIGIWYLRKLGARHQFTLAEIGWRKPEWGRDILAGLGGWVSAMTLLLVGSVASNMIFAGLPEEQHPISVAAQSAGVLETVAIFFTACIVAPLVEETFFRGVLFMGLWRRTQSLWTAALLAAAAFALLHPMLFAGLLPIAGVGIVGCFVLRERRSLFACMVMHCLFNSTTLVMSLVSR